MKTKTVKMWEMPDVWSNGHGKYWVGAPHPESAIEALFDTKERALKIASQIFEEKGVVVSVIEKDVEVLEVY
jgi:hypothetical protein